MSNILRGLALFVVLAVTLSSCLCYRPYGYGGGYGRGYGGGGHHHGGGYGHGHHGGGGHYRR